MATSIKWPIKPEEDKPTFGHLDIGDWFIWDSDDHYPRLFLKTSNLLDRSDNAIRISHPDEKSYSCAFPYNTPITEVDVNIEVSFK